MSCDEQTHWCFPNWISESTTWEMLWLMKEYNKSPLIWTREGEAGDLVIQWSLWIANLMNKMMKCPIQTLGCNWLQAVWEHLTGKEVSWQRGWRQTSRWQTHHCFLAKWSDRPNWWLEIHHEQRVHTMKLQTLLDSARLRRCDAS